MSKSRVVTRKLKTSIAGKFLIYVHDRYLHLLYLILNNSTSVPHLLKQKFILARTENQRPKYFVETGTYLGGMIHKMRN